VAIASRAPHAVRELQNNDTQQQDPP
jgi:hypothetical protein